jgi:hypothetical protein
MATVVVACFVQSGLQLIPPSDQFKDWVILDGPRGHERGAKFTEVDDAFWQQWLATFATSSLITSGAVAAVGS